MDIIDQTLSALSIGEPSTYCNLAVFPLFADEARKPDYLTLDEGLEQGACRVTEISEGGSVPELRFENPSDHRILLLDGEELIGARQNRVLNITILVGARHGGHGSVSGGCGCLCPTPRVPGRHQMR
jgi:hypothetical protein